MRPGLPGGVGLRDLLAEHQAEFASRKPAVPYKFAQDAIQSAVSCLLLGYAGMRYLCEDIEKLPAAPREEARRRRYTQILGLHAAVSKLLSPTFPHDLYFLVDHFSRDLGLLHLKICLIDGQEFRNTSPTSYIPDITTLTTAMELYGAEAAEVSKKFSAFDLGIFIVDVPTAHLRNPHTWVLVAHECVHRLDLIKKIGADIEGFAKEVPPRKQIEVLVDLLTSNYLGPTYSHMMIDLPRQSSGAGSDAHPCAGARWSYLMAITKWYRDNGSLQTTSKLTALQRSLLEMTEASLAKALAGIGSPIVDVGIANFVEEHIHNVQATVHRHMRAAGIPRWDEQFQEDVSSSILALKNAEPENLLRDLFSRRLMLALSPSTLFNLAIIAEHAGVQKEAVAEAVRFSLRKGAVACAARRATFSKRD